MEINNRIREQVIRDLKVGMVTDTGDPMVATFFNGSPSFIQVPEIEDDGDIPAVAVAISDGQSTEESLDEITWQAIMTVRVYLVADNDTEPELDAFGEKILSLIGTNYDANGLLSLCNRRSFDYGRDDEQPWGTLDLLFTIEYTEEI
ncbi:phage tail terminator protein [Vibrio vulnificus]|uniref:phage tail terminator protein n=1 Tax=Vibrio vulnificus TaxID=672 RepID=UPI00102AE1E5|nr:phage tail terminator protein [Vibrio vulnificus]ELV8603661.1 hypothetical protein [Vibrio vulnificus]ELV8659185.1 hypothetical protein [Vibrio vulnificus]MCA3991442.1 hypothetical protein [Vibrio vulnificus]RZQ90340.1 hypothetical protein D8T27_04625 [Vibrio vulnificus]